MAKQSEITRGINPGYTKHFAVGYLRDIRKGMYGKLPNAVGLNYDEISLLAAIDALAGVVAGEHAANVPITSDQLRVKIMRQLAEHILRAEGDVMASYSPCDTGDDE